MIKMSVIRFLIKEGLLISDILDESPFFKASFDFRALRQKALFLSQFFFINSNLVYMIGCYLLFA